MEVSTNVPAGWLCVECGRVTPDGGTEPTCPKCHVHLIEIGPNSVSDRVLALVGAALSRRRQRVESWAVLGGAGLGTATGLAIIGASRGASAFSLFAVLAAAVLLACVGWLLVPSFWALAQSRRKPPLHIQGINPRRRFVLAAALILAPPLAFASALLGSGRHPEARFVAYARSPVAAETLEPLLGMVREHAAEVGACHRDLSHPGRGEWFVWVAELGFRPGQNPTVRGVHPARDAGGDCVREVVSRWTSASPASATELIVEASVVVRRSFVFGTLEVSAPTAVEVEPWAKSPLFRDSRVTSP